MQYKWDAYHSSNDMNHKTIQRNMPMRAGDEPWERESFYERNENDIITTIGWMIRGTENATKWIGTTDYNEAADRTIPHGTSQNLRKKASCNMHVILWGHFLSNNIHHFHIPGQQGEEHTHTHTLRAHQQLSGLTIQDRTKTTWHWICACYSAAENPSVFRRSVSQKLAGTKVLQLWSSWTITEF